MHYIVGEDVKFQPSFVIFGVQINVKLLLLDMFISVTVLILITKKFRSPEVPVG